MLTKYLTCRIDKVTGLRILTGKFLQKSRIITIRNKANILTVRLMRHRYSRILSHLTYFTLLILTKRHQRARQLLLSQVTKRICLVLGGCRCILNRETTVHHINIGIVPRRNVKSAFSVCNRCKHIPLNCRIAKRTRIGSSAVSIFICKVFHHCGFKLIGHILNHMLNSKHTRTRGRIGSKCLFLKLLHGHANDFIPFFLQKKRRHRGINASRKSYHNFFLVHYCSLILLKYSTLSHKASII